MHIYELGQKDTCSICRIEIEFNGDYWHHIGKDFRHTPTPLNNKLNYLGRCLIAEGFSMNEIIRFLFVINGVCPYCCDNTSDCRCSNV